MQKANISLPASESGSYTIRNRERSWNISFFLFLTFHPRDELANLKHIVGLLCYVLNIAINVLEHVLLVEIPHGNLFFSLQL